MTARPRFHGHHRMDDPLSEPDEAEVDIDLLPYDETDPDYLERRREILLEHYRRQLQLAELNRDDRRAAMWRRLLAEVEIPEHWRSGEGDRMLF